MRQTVERDRVIEARLSVAFAVLGFSREYSILEADPNALESFHLEVVIDFFVGSASSLGYLPL